jgi:hypothetical protein
MLTSLAAEDNLEYTFADKGNPVPVDITLRLGEGDFPTLSLLSDTHLFAGSI